jgi:hypothetical protein
VVDVVVGDDDRDCGPTQRRWTIGPNPDDVPLGCSQRGRRDQVGPLGQGEPLEATGHREELATLDVRVTRHGREIGVAEVFGDKAGVA